jgi:hypothetical protein
MDRPIIISRKILDDMDFAGLFPVSGYDMIDDVLMPYMLSLEAAEESGGLQLVVIVVIQCGSRFLIVEDDGIYSMGFVRECLAPSDEPVNSLCNVAVPAAQTLIEYYAPGIKYAMDVLGIMQCEQLGNGSEWLGCLFLAEISREVEKRNFGFKKVTMMSSNEISERLGSEWGLDIVTLARACSGIS